MTTVSRVYDTRLVAVVSTILILISSFVEGAFCHIGDYLLLSVSLIPSAIKLMMYFRHIIIFRLKLVHCFPYNFHALKCLFDLKIDLRLRC